jgi:predicted DCC family thiol-disulfide oxidoreductase YuxK
LQSKVGQSLLLQSGRQPDDISSIVVCHPDGTAHVESDAILTICKGLSGPLPVVGKVGVVVPKPVRNALYQVVSQNRWKFGKSDSCRMDYDGEFDNRFVPDP